MRRFRLSETPIDAGAQRLSLEDPAAGGCVTFEGWVRNHNEARAVTRLDYQAYGPLAEDEGEAILAEATTKFALRAVRCMHRTGSLAIGDLAVWVGVSAGSMVMTPRIGQEFVEWAGAPDDRTLGLVDFSIFPHLDVFPDNTLDAAERWAEAIGGPAYAVDDQTAIRVVDGAVDVVSEGQWHLLG